MSLKILIADDDGVSRSMLDDALQQLGHEVTAVEDGLQAWQTLQTEHFPIVVTDWVMPGLDGLQLCQRIRGERRPEYTFVFLLTVREGKGHFLEAMKAGVDDFITKPFDEDQLAARIAVAERILHLREQNRRMAQLLPVCAWCKRVRNDQQYWKKVDEFLAESTGRPITHGICPECMEEQRRAFAARRQQQP